MLLNVIPLCYYLLFNRDQNVRRNECSLLIQSVTLYLKICVDSLTSFFFSINNSDRWSHGLRPLTHKFELVYREKSDKKVKVALVKLLHWADSSALLERSHVGYGLFLKSLLWI